MVELAYVYEQELGYCLHSNLAQVEFSVSRAG